MIGVRKWTRSELQVVTCDLCGSEYPRHKAIFQRRDDLQVVQCETCGLAFVNPRPQSESIEELYRREYFEAGGESGIGYANYEANAMYARLERRQLLSDRLRVVAKHVDLGGSTLLEVGCATGDFVQLASRAGSRTVGIDIAPDAIARAQKRYPRLEFRRATVSQIAASGTAFDCVCAFEVIEHVPSPRAFLRDLRQLCRRGGRLLVSTPNFAYGSAVGVDRWLGLQRSFEHLYFLEPATLRALAALEGFTVEEWYGAGGGIVTVENPMKTRTRKTLASLGLLPLARLVRTGLASTHYQPRRVAHSMLAVLQ